MFDDPSSQRSLAPLFIAIAIALPIAGLIPFLALIGGDQKPTPETKTPESIMDRSGARENSARAVRAQQPNPAAEKPITAPSRSRDWSHKDLCSHLISRGVRVVVGPAPAEGGCVAAYLYRPGSPYVQNRLQAAEDTMFVAGSAIVYCVKHATEEAASDAAGIGPGRVAWGRFSFRGDPELLPKIREALSR